MKNFSDEELGLLARAETEGGLVARLYVNGVFSEPAFVAFGAMQRLAIRGRLTYLGHTGGQLNGAYRFALPDAEAAMDRPTLAAA